MRAAVVLRYYADMSVREAAEALGTSENTVKTQLREALEHMRSALGRGRRDAGGVPWLKSSIRGWRQACARRSTTRPTPCRSRFGSRTWSWPAENEDPPRPGCASRSSLLAAAAAIVILVIGAGAWRIAALPSTGTASSDPRAAELESYADLAARLPNAGLPVVIAQGEDLAGAAPGTGPKETVIGTIPANAYVDWVFDCRGNSVSVSLRRGQEAPGGAMPCGQQPTVFSFPGFDTPSEVVVMASTDTVWRLVLAEWPPAKAAPPLRRYRDIPDIRDADPALAGLATFEELELRPSAPRSVLVRGEGTAARPSRRDRGAVPLRLRSPAAARARDPRPAGCGPAVGVSTVACRQRASPRR